MARKSTTRERLIHTAGQLFWQQGYAQTGVSEIIKRARATSGSFYHFFATKDDLLLAVVESVADRLEGDVLGPAEAGSPDPAQRVARVVDAYRRATSDPSAGSGLPVGALVRELGETSGRTRAVIARIYSNLVDRIGGWLDRPTAELIVASLEGASLMAAASGTTETLDHCAAELSRIIEESARVHGDRSSALRPPTASGRSAADWRAW